MDLYDGLAADAENGELVWIPHKLGHAPADHNQNAFLFKGNIFNEHIVGWVSGLLKVCPSRIYELYLSQIGRSAQKFLWEWIEMNIPPEKSIF